jgi:ABC-type branched-subunit amino acid transport system substrate-binding protein
MRQRRTTPKPDTVESATPMKFRTGRSAALVTVIVLLAAGCTSHSPQNATGPTPTVAKTIKLVNAEQVTCSAAITSKCLTVGNISTISGPVPGLFEGGAVGADAYFSYLDSTQGGIDGRKVSLISDDDQFNGQTNQNDTQQLISKVLAFVGSFSLEDEDGGTILAQHPTVPNVSMSLSPTTIALQNTIMPQPTSDGWAEGPLLYFAHKYPQAIKHVGILVAQEAAAEYAATNLEAGMKHEGYKIVYSELYGPLDTNFTPEVLAMKSAGVQFVDLTETDATNAEDILAEMYQQGYHPQVIESAGPLYVDDFTQKSGGPQVTDGVYLDQEDALYLGADAKSVPEVNTMLSWIQKIHPGFTTDLFTLYGWCSAMLFAEGLEHAGSDPDSASLLTSLKNIHSFDAGGLMAPDNPGSRQPPSCWLLARVVNGVYVRIAPSPKSSFICDAGYFHR